MVVFFAQYSKRVSPLLIIRYSDEWVLYGSSVTQEPSD